MIFLEEPISQFQVSTQTNLVSLSLICPSTCLVQLKSLRFKFLIDLLRGNVGISLFPISCLNLSLSFIQFSVSHHLSSNGRVDFPFKDFLEILSIFQRMHNVCVSISLPFRLWTKNRCCNRFSVRNCPSFLEAWSTRHMICHAWRSERWRNSACCCFAAAGCSWVGQTFWVNGGDHGSVVLALEIVVAVWEMDRRVHCVQIAEEVGGVGLITCVWSWASHSARPTPASGCAWAVSATPCHGWRGRWRSGLWRGRWRQNTWKRKVRDVEQRHQGTRRRWNTKTMTRTLFTLEPCRVRMIEVWHVHEKNVRVCARWVRCPETWSLIINVALLASHLIFGPLSKFVFSVVFHDKMFCSYCWGVRSRGVTGFPSSFSAFRTILRTLFSKFQRHKRRYPFLVEEGNLWVSLSLSLSFTQITCNNEHQCCQIVTDLFFALRSGHRQHVQEAFKRKSNEEFSNSLDHFDVSSRSWWSDASSLNYVTPSALRDSRLSGPLYSSASPTSLFFSGLVFLLQALQDPTSRQSTPRTQTRTSIHQREVESSLWVHFLLYVDLSTLREMLQPWIPPVFLCFQLGVIKIFLTVIHHWHCWKSPTIPTHTGSCSRQYPLFQ